MTNQELYREELFQWIWQQVEFDCRNLKTYSGKSLQIIDTGSLNYGAGPDFLGAHLRIAQKDWYGSVEIHKKAGEWGQHGHGKDKAFNSVILHVIFEEGGLKKIQTADGHEPFTLVLKPYLKKNLFRLLEAKQSHGIACSGNVSFINQRAFEKQIAKAQKEYLEYKVEELLEFYDPSLPVSAAWRRCLIIGMYRTLGIPSNKTQMSDLAQASLRESKAHQDVMQFLQMIQKIAFKSEKDFHWVHNGMRPASRPACRVKQAAHLHFAINQVPFQFFFKNTADQTWKQILANVNQPNKPGKARLSLIKQLVYLPALYLLGDLLQSNKCKHAVLEEWNSSIQHVPDEIIKPFKKAGFEINAPAKKIGLAHQYKRYCKKKNCYNCEVFKKAIRS